MMNTIGPLGRTKSEAFWRSRLAICSAVAVLFLSLSGLVVWLWPFGPLAQITVLVHTLLGLVFIVPVVVYGIRHWLDYRQQALTHTKFLGYLSTGVLIACGISGLILTYQPLFGTRISYFWRAVHDWTTVALLIFVLPHILIPAFRAARAQLSDSGAAVWQAVRSFGTAVVVLTSCLLACILLADYAYEPPRMAREFSPDYDLWEPKNPLYGKNRPFAPSLARTIDNKPIDARLLSGSEGCGTSGCHQQILQEWKPSAHRYSAMDKAFQAIQMTMARQNGPTSTRYCGGCHDPISLFSGTKNIYADEAQLTALQGFHEGVSCLSCHSVRETDIKGNAHFVVQAPRRYLGEIEYDQTQSRSWRVLRDFLIRAYPRTHVASLSKAMFKKPEYCAACHKQFVDEEINKVGWVQLQNQYDNWRMSKWARDLKQPAHVIECRECHMPLVPSEDPASGDASDYNRSAQDRKHRSHRFLGANQLMPALLNLEGADRHVELIRQWLRGEFPIPEIEKKWHQPGVPAVSIQLVVPEKVRPREKVVVRCVVTSNKVGHDFPTGPLDIIQSWIEIVARNQNGQVIYESGTVDDKGFIKPGSFLFKAEPVDQYGNLIDRHNLWEMVGVRNRRSLFPGFSDTAEFNFLCPDLDSTKRQVVPVEQAFSFQASRSGKIEIVARLRYRKIDQFLLNFVRSVGFFPEFKGKTLTSPITDMHQQKAEINIVS